MSLRVQQADGTVQTATFRKPSAITPSLHEMIATLQKPPQNNSNHAEITATIQKPLGNNPNQPSHAFACGGGGGGGYRAPQNWGGGVGKRAQLTDTIITNEKKLRIHFWLGHYLFSALVALDSRGCVANLPTCGPLLILSPALRRWGPPRQQGLCSQSALLWAFTVVQPFGAFEDSRFTVHVVLMGGHGGALHACSCN